MVVPARLIATGELQKKISKIGTWGRPLEAAAISDFSIFDLSNF